MILFWLLTGLMAAGAAVLILRRSHLAERAGTPDDPALGVYRRQLSEIDELADRGLLGQEEQRAAHAEVGRRLMREADRSAASPAPVRPGTGRSIVAAVAALVPLAALGAYLAVGSPGLPDQPFKGRLAAWRAAARADPSKLDLAELAAVLEASAAEHPRDLVPLFFLAKVQAEGGDPGAAARTLRKAAALAPGNAEIWSGLGETLTAQAQGEVTPDARQAFERAAAIDPAAPGPLYYLGRADIAAGRLDAGLARWRVLAAALPAADPRRAAVDAEIAETARTGRLVSAQAPAQAQAQPGAGADEAAFIQSMVDRLAARLKTQPDDPAGWARLIRAYGVLGQQDRRQAAMAEARRLFKDRPDALRVALAGT